MNHIYLKQRLMGGLTKRNHPVQSLRRITHIRMTKINRNEKNERSKRAAPSIEVEIAVEEQSRGTLHIHGAYITAVSEHENRYFITASSSDELVSFQDESVLTEATHKYVRRRIVLGAEAAYRLMEQWGRANQNQAMVMAAYIVDYVVKDDKRPKGA